MKLKYYLRGLGIGIFISTIILSISFSGRNKALTNVEIMDKAKELGMMDEKDLELELSKKLAKFEEEEQAEEINEETNEETKIEGSEETSETEADDSEEISEEAKIEDIEEVDTEETETITFTIESGMWSEEVSKILENNSLITNAKEFNTYLIQNGYQSRICTGKHTISKGATFEEIAKTITSR